MIEVPTAAWAHTAFDIAAWSAGAALALGNRPAPDTPSPDLGGGYYLALLAGAIPGAWIAGSLVSLAGANPALSHSLVGALVGAIAAVEAYKAHKGITRSTGLRWVAPFAAGAVIGRLGCFFSGVRDGTYGRPTDLPWAVNLGDGVGRHPVQVYESLAMAVFLAGFLTARRLWPVASARRGFYAMCAFYGAQRFCWEFLKPYPTLVGPFNLFHLLCGGLVAYGWVFSVTDRRRQRAEERAVPVPGPDHEPLRNLP